jgi:hypothetical protein
MQLPEQGRRVCIAPACGTQHDGDVQTLTIEKDRIEASAAQLMFQFGGEVAREQRIVTERV